ncbi:hypothetical protein KXX33_008940 [Aspergillus fumigatus]|uniref:Uncharacterized protein n=1 Tax=Aspergillus hiratsukae TaxID=1194566 RepID=A0A8H6PA01_9EURO|nr:hypothetical protein CNMCM5793_000258 [Aspergillus hiratsukae]KAH1310691.1 hypothetical protein KXX47_006195 [Aspergillus fumigatus]KAH1352529.1 hypothetical protein KXX33_008940 [Aspergillus fumigatus]KAH1379767.1 hypothetical protein KXX49_006778 [Aspergillus fumigatus]KAH1400359.1 hypothetical protein KXX22_005772 [Aspergillus fumigatus]
MAYHTIRGLAEACQQRHQYIPAVALQPKGGKSPLWLVHAAAGEALIFINLARLINDQPVYAFKARGFEVKWTDCLVNISYFLGLLSRASFRDLLQQLYHLPKKEATACLIKVADPARLVALALDNDKPEQWIDVAPSPQEVGRNYTPQGSVAHMDVFHCDPLEFLNVTPQEWQQREHFTVLGPANV